MTKPFYISPSGLNRFFTCPAQYDYGKKWKLKEEYEDQGRLDGITAHALMAGQKIAATARAEYFYHRLRLLETEMGYRIIDREKRETIAIGSVRLIVIRDARAYDGETPVVLDYKTGTWPWYSEDGFTPKAMGFQATAYSYPGKWDDGTVFRPKRVDFLIATEKGSPEVFPYQATPRDKNNLIQAITHVREVKTFPKVRGGHCKFCSFFEMCYDVKGWKDHYVQREPNLHHEEEQD